MSELVLPPLVPSFSLLGAADTGWAVGRAGMLYRDLIRDRQGGRFIASQIRIEQGGDVGDWVHHHSVRMQLIYCTKGWVEVVYEDQGDPLVMRPGDCVLQPPGIRHRVLQCAAQTEVVEVACPADYATEADVALALPTGRVLADRDFGGQRFVFHRADAATIVAGVRDLGLGAATDDLVHARVIDGGDAGARVHDGELCFTFVLGGSLTLECAGQPTHTLGPGDAVVIPAGVEHRFNAESTAQRLEIAVGSSPHA